MSAENMILNEPLIQNKFEISFARCSYFFSALLTNEREGNGREKSYENRVKRRTQKLNEDLCDIRV